MSVKKTRNRLVNKQKSGLSKLLKEQQAIMIIKFSILTIVLLFSFQTSFAQTEKRIAAIRAEVAAIEKGAANYTRKTNNVEDISLEGTEAIYFTEKTSLKKITSKMYGETFNATGEFYYRDGQLIFAFSSIINTIRKSEWINRRKSLVSKNKDFILRTTI